jgi:ribosomal protein S17E
MTPQEKAKELFNKYADNFNFDDTYRSYRQQAKQCALIAVNEIYNEIHTYYERYEYWQEVKQEIEKL